MTMSMASQIPLYTWMSRFWGRNLWMSLLMHASCSRMTSSSLGGSLPSQPQHASTMLCSLSKCRHAVTAWVVTVRARWYNKRWWETWSWRHHGTKYLSGNQYISDEPLCIRIPRGSSRNKRNVWDAMALQFWLTPVHIEIPRGSSHERKKMSNWTIRDAMGLHFGWAPVHIEIPRGSSHETKEMSNSHNKGRDGATFLMNPCALEFPEARHDWDHLSMRQTLTRTFVHDQHDVASRTIRSKSTFSQTLEEKWISEVVRIGMTMIIFHDKGNSGVRKGYRVFGEDVPVNTFLPRLCHSQTSRRSQNDSRPANFTLAKRLWKPQTVACPHASF